MIRMLDPATLRESCLAITGVLEAGILPEGVIPKPRGIDITCLKTKHSILDRIGESLFYAHAAEPVIVVERLAKLDRPSQRALSLTPLLSSSRSFIADTKRSLMEVSETRYFELLFAAAPATIPAVFSEHRE
jgi:hypothetical protein